MTLVVHIGLPKTMTTTVQSAVFPLTMMQDFLPKLAGSTQYELPDKLCLGQQYDDNVAFYRELLAAPEGYLRVVTASTNELSNLRDAK